VAGDNGAVLFERRLREGLRSGLIRLAFRRWRRPQAVSGRRYRSPIGLIEVGNVSVVRGPISLGDAQLAGYLSVAELLADLKGPPDGSIYRLELHRTSDSDPRDELAERTHLDEAELGQLQRRLARLDADRSWTMATLRAIQAGPGLRAADLAAALGWPEVLVFKLHVRKLKALGLTHSLRVGYRLTPRGEAYLRATSPAA
jgi:hypothetical protein